MIIVFKPYCKMHTGDYNMIEVVYDFDKKSKKSVVRFEKPDAKLCFKVFECELPSYRVLNNVGFSEAEVKHLLEFCMCNASLLLTEDA